MIAVFLRSPMTRPHRATRRSRRYAHALLVRHWRQRNWGWLRPERDGWRMQETWTRPKASAAVGAKIHSPVDARVASDGAVGLRVLVPAIVDPRPGESGIVGAIDTPDTVHLSAAVERRVPVPRRRLAEADGAGRVDAPQLVERVAAVERMPDAVDRCCAAAGEPEIALAARRGLELNRSARRRKAARTRRRKSEAAIDARIERAVPERVELQRFHAIGTHARPSRCAGGCGPRGALVGRDEHARPGTPHDAAAIGRGGHCAARSARRIGRGGSPRLASVGREADVDAVGAAVAHAHDEAGITLRVVEARA